MAWIALDAGTSLIKAVVFDRSGCEIAVARQRTTVLHPRPDWSEQSMTDVWNSAADTIRQVAAQVGETLEGLAITAQGDGCWLVDEQLQPTGHALLWNDGRGAELIEHWRTQGIIEQAFRRSGSVAYPGLSSALLRWLMENDPDRLARSRYVLSANGLLFAQLTHQIAADLSDGSNPFCDVQAGEYDAELFRLFGLERQRTMFPDLHRGANLCASLTRSAALATGLPEGLPVVMAPYDIVATAYGAGVVNAGQSCLILGTTICAEAITAQVDLAAPPAGTTLALESGAFLRAMPTLAGCETLEWTARMLGLQNLDDFEALAAQATAAARDLVFLPYLSEAGERSPFLDPYASGSIHGLKLTHTRADLAFAVYAGLSFAIHECLRTAAGQITEVRVSGGGARSALWCQRIADTTGLKVLRPVEHELGARGAFLFGLLTVGAFRDLRAATEALPLQTDVFEPSPARGTCEAEFARFLEQREAVRRHWRPRRDA